MLVSTLRAVSRIHQKKIKLWEAWWKTERESSAWACVQCQVESFRGRLQDVGISWGLWGTDWTIAWLNPGLPGCVGQGFADAHGHVL